MTKSHLAKFSAPISTSLLLIALAGCQQSGSSKTFAADDLKSTPGRQASPADAEAFYLKGVAAERQEQPEAAFEFYQQAAGRAPNEPVYLLAESRMLCAIDRNFDALALLQSKANNFQRSAAVRSATGQLLMRAGRYAQALDLFREANLLSKEDRVIREQLAQALYVNAAYQQCVDVLGGLVADGIYAHRADLFVVLADCQLHLSAPRDARATLQTAIQLNPNSPRAWQLLGQAAVEDNDIQAAQMALARSIALDPKNSESQLQLGYLLLRQDQITAALTAFANTPLDATNSVRLCLAGYIIEKLGRPAEATNCYSQALRLRSGDEGASQIMASIDLIEAGN